MFQCLLIDGENAGEDALREAERFVISDLQFQEFLDRHSSVSCLVPESNEAVRRAHAFIHDESFEYRGGKRNLTFSAFSNNCQVQRLVQM